MGYVLVKAPAAAVAPQGVAGLLPPRVAERPQGFTSGAGGPFSFISDPTFPEGSAFSSPTVGQNAGDPNSGMLIEHPSSFEFTDPITGKTSVEQSPLHDPNDPSKPLIEANPFYGQNIHSNAQLAGMKGARALGTGLGIYSALMSFGDDSDQDVVTAAMNAGLTGYSTYAQFAQLAQHFDRRGQNQLAEKLRGYANEKASQAFLQQNPHRRKVNLQNAKLAPNAGFPLMVNNPKPKVAGKPVGVLGPGVGGSGSRTTLGPAVSGGSSVSGRPVATLGSGYTEGDTTFHVEEPDNSDILIDEEEKPVEEKPVEEEKKRQTHIDDEDEWKSGGAWG